MKFFVTFDNDQLSYDIMNAFFERGYEDLASDIAEVYAVVTDGLPIPRIPYVSLDIKDKEKVEKAATNVKLDAVMHCAAWTDVDMADDDDKVGSVRRVNAGGTQNIADDCMTVNCEMLYLPTDYAFDSEQIEPWKPHCKDYKPLNVYSQTKLQRQFAVSSTLEKYFIVRITLGFGFNGKNLIKTMNNVGKTHDEERVDYDHRQVLLYLYV